MSEFNSVTVIIVSYYTGNVLFECINSVLRLKFLENIILIDNGNPQIVGYRLAELAQKNQKIKLVSGHGNIGFARACNMGARLAETPFLLFLNPDCIVPDPNSLSKMIKILINPPQAKEKMDNNYKVVTCQILNKDHSMQKTCRRSLLTPLVILSEVFYLHKFSSKFKPQNLPIIEIYSLPNVSEVPALSGAVVFTTKEYYHQIGGFDETYFLYFEDMDFSMKIHLKGDKIAFIKNTTIQHMLSTSEVSNKFVEYHKARSFLLYMQKFFPIFRSFLLSNFLKAIIWLRYLSKIIFCS